MSHPFKLVPNQYDSIGHCQLTYTTKNSEGQRIFYCLQDNGEKFGGIRLMRCTQDFEPCHEVKLQSKAVAFELPVINEDQDSDYTIKLKQLCIDWIKANATALEQ